MSTVRAQIAAQITADNAGFAVKAFPATPPDNLGAGKVQVAVYRSNLVNSQLNLEHDIEIEIMAGGTASAANEDSLDAALDEVLLSLERINGVVWSSAERSVMYEKFHGYKVTVKVTSPNVYKNLVRNEQKAVTP